MRIIVYIFLLYLIAFYYTMMAEVLTIYGVALDLVGLVVAMVAIYRGTTASLWFGVSAAIVAATMRPDLMSWQILSLAGMAVIINQISIRLNLDSILSRLAVMAIFLLVHNIVITLKITSEDFFFVSYRFILPGVVYTLVVGWVAFSIIDGVFGLKRSDSLT
jgi:hypothetical protein